MDIGKLTIDEAREIGQLFGGRETPDTAFLVGQAYLIRTVTLYYTGRVKTITGSELVLEDAAWIADTGRFSDALESGVFNEVEPFRNDVIVPRGGIIDATAWMKPLPRVQN